MTRKNRLLAVGLMLTVIGILIGLSIGVLINTNTRASADVNNTNNKSWVIASGIFNDSIAFDLSATKTFDNQVIAPDVVGSFMIAGNNVYFSSQISTFSFSTFSSTQYNLASVTSNQGSLTMDGQVYSNIKVVADITKGASSGFDKVAFHFINSEGAVIKEFPPTTIKNGHVSLHPLN